MKSPYFTEEHEMFRKEVRKFVEKEIIPHANEWEKNQRIPRDIWEKMGSLGFLGITFPENYSGTALDIFYALVFMEEIVRSGMGGFSAAIAVQEFMAPMHLSKVGSEELKQKYLVPSIQGKKVGALAISEPNVGSDVAGIQTKAVRDGDHYVINGAKTFITNGFYGDFVTMAVKTDPSADAEGISLIVVDRDTPGFSTRMLEKIGWHCSDTAELTFEDVRVPVGNLIGQENMGFYYIMESFQIERLMAAILATAGAEYCLEVTLRYINERQAFNRPISKFQAIRHMLADLATEIEAGKQLTYHTAWLHQQGEQAIKESSMAKLFCTELANRVVDRCLQCFGGYGYMEEYAIARAYRDARVGTIVAGTSEIMREIISRIVIDEVSYESGYEKAEKQARDTTPEQRESQEPSPEPVPAPTPEASPASTPSTAPLPQTVAEIFASLPGRFRPERTVDWHAIFHFDISGDQGGKYTVHIDSGMCRVEQGLNGNPDCVLTTKDKTYVDMELGKINAQMAYMLRKVKVSNLSQMMRYIKAFRRLFKREK